VESDKLRLRQLPQEWAPRDSHVAVDSGVGRNGQGKMEEHRIELALALDTDHAQKGNALAETSEGEGSHREEHQDRGALEREGLP
jgi:hypothetical protein